MVSRAVARVYRGLALVTLVATFFLIVTGAVVRVTGSGLGCPDWPTCHGSWVPPLRADALIEYAHRLSVALVSVLILLTLAGALITYRRRPAIWGLASLTFGLLIVQIVLGAITVRLELPEDVVTLHLGTAEAILGTLVVLNLAFVRPRGAVEQPSHRPNSRRDRFLWLAGAGALGIYALILSGAFVRGHGAAGACGTDWPLCLGSPFPTSELTAVHLGHRYLVAVVALMIGAIVVHGWRRRSLIPALGHASLTLGALFVIQVVVGAANPWTQLAPAARAAHLAVASLVWSSGLALVVLAWWLPPVPRVLGARTQPAGAPVAPPALVSDTSGS